MYTVERTGPCRMTKVDYTVDWTVVYTVERTGPFRMTKVDYTVAHTV